MRKLALIVLLLGSTLSVLAQEVATSTATTAQEQIVPLPKTDWLTAFNGVKINGPMNVSLKRVATPEEGRITYDTKGCLTSKFKAEIDKNGTLVIEEKSDPKRTTVTDVTIYYSTLSRVKVVHAHARFHDTIERDMFDIEVSGGAVVSMGVKTLDLAVYCTGRSMLTLSGETKYLTMKSSTAKIDGAKLSTMASIVDVSHGAEVRINVSERLEATTSTSAMLLYKGSPKILRDHTALFGGSIVNID